MSSWLSLPLPNPFKSPQDDGEEVETDEEKSSSPVEENEQNGEESATLTGVKEDLSELTKTISRQLWGVASFLAPPPLDSSSNSSDSSSTLVGIRNDFAEIGGSFKTGLSQLSTHKAINEISKLASTILQFQPDDSGDIFGVSEEVLEFTRDVSARPVAWLDFPLPPFGDDFDMSDAQTQHASTVERLTPSLAALKLSLCPSHISEGRFWLIYFLLLQPILSEHDSKLLVTPKVLEAQNLMKQQQQLNKIDTQVQSSDAGCLSQVSSKGIIIREENNDVQEKEVLAESVTAHQLSTDEQENLDGWFEESSEMGTFVDSIDAKEHHKNEADVSFSDLEIDDDDDDRMQRLVTSSSVQEKTQVSSSNNNNEWVQLRQNSEAHDGKSKVTHSNSKKDCMDSDESSDWLTVDDFNLDSGNTI